MRGITPVVLFAASLAAAPSPAAEHQVAGSLTSDLRLSLPGKPPPEGSEELRFVRTDNTARLKLRSSSGDVSGQLDIGLVYRGVARPLSLDDARSRELSDPFDLESDALFLTITDIMVEGLELRVGRQVVQWGKADQFNPTSVLNPLDLEDPVDFGARIPNEMVLLSYLAPWSAEGDDFTIFDELTFTGALVPVHRPAQYPSSARVVFTDPDLFVQFVDSPLLASFLDLQKAFVTAGGVFDYRTEVDSPPPALENAQYAGRVSWTLLSVDMSAMYFDGFSDALQASEVVADLSSDLVVVGSGTDLCGPYQAPQCGEVVSAIIGDQEPDEAFEQLQALLDSAEGLEGTIPTRVRLTHPEVKVVGFDAATSLDFIGGVGVWGEAAVTFHGDQKMILRAADKVYEETLLDEGHFWKVAAGLDYTIVSWWYLNAQYLHGFVDEFGTQNLNDYVVAGSDFKLLNDRLVLRVFGIYQVQDQSYVVYPNLMAQFWPGTQISLGAFFMGGADDSKFGSPASGQSRAFLKASYAF